MYRHCPEGSRRFAHQSANPVLSIVLALAMGMLSACGYHLAAGGALPGGIQNLAVHMLVNRTSQTGLETRVTNDLIAELIVRRQQAVVDTDQAQAVLTGTIMSLNREVVSRSSSHQSLERRVIVTISLVLTARDGQVLWTLPELSAEQAYSVADNASGEDVNLQPALARVSERLAEAAIRRLTESF